MLKINLACHSSSFCSQKCSRKNPWYKRRWKTTGLQSSYGGPIIANRLWYLLTYLRSTLAVFVQHWELNPGCQVHIPYHWPLHHWSKCSFSLSIVLYFLFITSSPSTFPPLLSYLLILQIFRSYVQSRVLFWM